jgi:hypothetical protein
MYFDIATGGKRAWQCVGNSYVENVLIERDNEAPLMRNYLRRRLDYFDLLAVAAILLGIAIISGIFYTYDVTRQTVRDDARAETRLNNQQLPDNL